MPAFLLRALCLVMKFVLTIFIRFFAICRILYCSLCHKFGSRLRPLPTLPSTYVCCFSPYYMLNSIFTALPRSGQLPAPAAPHFPHKLTAPRRGSQSAVTLLHSTCNFGVLNPSNTSTNKLMAAQKCVNFVKSEHRTIT